MELKKKFLTILMDRFLYLLLTLTNDLNFDVEMMRYGEQFHIPVIILKLLFNFKKAKPRSVDVEAVKEAIFVFNENFSSKIQL